MRKSTLLLLAMMPLFLAAQVQKFKWGSYSKQEQQLMQFKNDTISTAIVLSDVGKRVTERGNPMVLDRHLRIKIVSEKGIKEYGEMSIDFYSAKDIEKVGSIKAQTLNIDALSGKKTITKVEKGSIFKEKINDKWSRMKIAFPNLHVGSVIEIKYKHKKEDYSRTAPWYFQREIPTLYSEYSAKIFAPIDYKVVQYGVETIATNTWVAKNKSAIRNEPWCPNENDYRARVHLQMAGYETGSGYVKHINSWDKLSKEYLTTNNVRYFLDAKSDVVKYLNGLSPNDPILKRVKTIHYRISSVFEWDNFYGLYPVITTRQFLKKKKGNRAAINLFYLTALKKAGINAKAALISRRTNGVIDKVYPLLDNFSDIVVLIEISPNKWVLSDATNSKAPYDLIPFDLIGDEALIVEKNKSYWHKIERPDFVSTNSQSMIKIDDDGMLIIQSMLKLKGYAALNFRNKLMAKGTRNTVDEIINNTLSSDVLDIQIKNLDEPYKELILILKLKGELDTSLPIVTMPSSVFNNFEKFGLKQNHRTLPLDFGYKRNHIERITIQLPENLNLTELPKSEKLVLEAQTATAEFYNNKINSKTIQFLNNVDFNSAFYKAKEYKNLKRLIDLTEAQYRTQIALRKSE